MIRLAQKQASVVIDTAMYEGAGTFLSRTAKSPSVEEGRLRAANQENEGNGAADTNTHELALAIISHSESSRVEPEMLRKSRVRLGLTLVERSGCNASSRSRLASIFDMWLTTERSRPLREDIEKARDLNSRLM